MKIDLHVHSEYSFDSLMKVEKIIDVAMESGLNGIAITDHNTVKGCLEAIKANKNHEFIIIPASEISTNMGEIIGYFVTDEIKSKNAFDVIDEIRGQGGIAVLAHPYKRMKAYPAQIIEKLDAIEGFNARIGNKTYLKRSWDLAKKHNLPMTAGSDAHFYFEIGRGISILRNSSDLEGVKKDIRQGEIKLMGTMSQPYVETLSQVIRMFKTKKPRLLFGNILLRSVLITFEIAQSKLKRRIEASI